MTSALLHPILGIWGSDFTWWSTRWHWPLHPFLECSLYYYYYFLFLAPHLLFVFYSSLWSHHSHILKLFSQPTNLHFGVLQDFILGPLSTPYTVPGLHLPTAFYVKTASLCSDHWTRGLFIYLTSQIRHFPNLVHYFAQVNSSFPGGSAGKESACNVGDLGSIPGLGRSPGEGNNYPLQYSGLEKSMDCIVHGVTESQTWLSNFHFTSLH